VAGARIEVGAAPRAALACKSANRPSACAKVQT
jgi:hypothetical protein